MRDVKELIPHRAPFLYVDKLDEVNEERIVGTRLYTHEDYFFQGHFPEYPVVPGVILVESMAQCGGCGVVELGYAEGLIPLLATVDKVKFRRQVVPDDEVRFEIDNIRLSNKVVRQKGKAYVGDELAAEASWLCILNDREVLLR